MRHSATQPKNPLMRQRIPIVIFVPSEKYIYPPKLLSYTTGKRLTTPFFLSPTCKLFEPSGAVAVNETARSDIPDSLTALGAKENPGFTVANSGRPGFVSILPGALIHCINIQMVLQ